jgi:hypothetical protein
MGKKYIVGFLENLQIQVLDSMRFGTVRKGTSLRNVAKSGRIQRVTETGESKFMRIPPLLAPKHPHDRTSAIIQNTGFWALLRLSD